MNWKYFGGAVILSVGLLLKAGAPLVPVILGVGLGALLNWMRLRGSENRSK